jgi:hypothetical protein
MPGAPQLWRQPETRRRPISYGLLDNQSKEKGRDDLRLGLSDLTPD